MNVTIETAFVAGGKSVVTGNCASAGDNWETLARGEAARIADGLGGVVVQRQPAKVLTFTFTDHTGKEQTSSFEQLIDLAVEVNGVVIAEVVAARKVS